MQLKSTCCGITFNIHAFFATTEDFASNLWLWGKLFFDLNYNWFVKMAATHCNCKFSWWTHSFFLFFGRRGRAIRTEVHARADDFSSMVSHFGNIDPSLSVFGSQLLAVSNAYRDTSPQSLRLCISYEISLYVLLPMTIQLSMSGQPSIQWNHIAAWNRGLFQFKSILPTWPWIFSLIWGIDFTNYILASLQIGGTTCHFSDLCESTPWNN